MEVRQISLTAKISLLVGAFAGLTAVIFALVSESYVSDLSEERAWDELRNSVHAVGPYLQQPYRQIEADLNFIGLSPAAHGIFRSLDNGGVDPETGFTTDVWRERLTAMFTAMLQARRSYMQIRLIAVDGDGRELARVDHNHGQIDVTPAEALQPKGHRDYVQAGRQLNRGEILVTGVSQNMEYGVIDADSPLTLRVLTPVFGPEDEVLGLLVINEYFEDIAEHALSQFELGTTVALLDRSGATYSWSPENVRGTLDYSPGDIDWTPAFPITRASRGPSGTATIENGNGANFLYYLDVPFGRAPHDVSFRLVALTPSDQLATATRELAGTHRTIGMALVILAVLAGSLAGQYVARPLSRLAQSVRHLKLEANDNRLPVNRSDEIGELARSFVAVATDLHASQSAEQSTQAQMQAIFDQTIDALITIDVSGSVLSINDAGLRMFGYTQNEVLGRNITMLMGEPEKSRHDEYLRRASSESVTIAIGNTREVTGITKDGRQITLELSVSKVRINDQQIIYCGLLRDVTERRAQQAQLEAYARDLQQANRSLIATNEKLDEANQDLRTFTHIVSHDLRAPLVNLQGFSQLLTDELEPVTTSARAPGSDEEHHSTERITKALRYITDASAKMQRQLDSILELSRLGRYELNPEVVDLSVLFKSALETHIGPDWSSHVRSDLNKLPQVKVDRRAIEIIINNLCSNAAKYRSKDRPLEIAIEATRDDTGVTLCVGDNGRGVAEEDLENMFQLFRRCGRPDTQGEGIGLAYTKVLATRIGGTIRCESRLDEGTRFYVRIPRSAEHSTRGTKAA